MILCSLTPVARCSLPSALALAALAVAACALIRPLAAQQPAAPPTAEQPDNYTWLEDIHGTKPMAWVKDHNQKTAAILEKDPRFAALQAEALQVLESPARLPAPQFRSGQVYNTWRDAQHLRGIVRRTTLDDYLTPEPRWQTVLDYDALSKADNQSWVGHGLVCLAPEEERCLVSLSAGGEDAVTLREFDLKTGQFVAGGFTLPRGKQDVAWLDQDTLLISRDWGPGSMSEAGYPITVRAWKRGAPLEQATEVFRGKSTDNGYGDTAEVYLDAQGHRAAIVTRGLTTFEQESYLLLPAGPAKLALPLKSQIEALLDGQLIVSLDEDWTPTGSKQSFLQGSIVSFSLEAAQRDPVHLEPTLVFAPTAQEFQQGLSATRNHLILLTLAHVQGRAYILTHTPAGQWERKSLPVPENLTVGIVTTSRTDDRFVLALTGFLTPPSLWLGDAASGSLTLAKSQKPLFDAGKDIVEQLEATSRDGTKVPYFVVRPKEMKFDGSNPTLLNAYGGFQSSSTPSYSPVTGKLWLERGGVFVLANIRGGGEFGPAWHEAGLKTRRQRIYDDFYAVSLDLVARKITSPRHLGIQGGSNGGLLMGVQFTQHPEAYRAIVIQVPLLDMLAFEHLSAGASWVVDYGSVSNPKERAFLASISPYNQLKKGKNYPEPLIFTTTADDRVGPVHARKFAARLEEFGYPFLYDEIVEGGHGAGADAHQEARTRAEVITYLLRKLAD